MEGNDPTPQQGQFETEAMEEENPTPPQEPVEVAICTFSGRVSADGNKANKEESDLAMRGLLFMFGESLHGDPTGVLFKHLLSSAPRMLEGINNLQNHRKFVLPAQGRSDEKFKNSVHQIVLPEFLIKEVAGTLIPKHRMLVEGLAATKAEEADANLKSVIQFLNIPNFAAMPAALQTLKGKEGLLTEMIRSLRGNLDDGSFTADSVTVESVAELANAIKSILELVGDANSLVEVPSKIELQKQEIESQKKVIVELKEAKAIDETTIKQQNEQIEALKNELAEEKEKSRSHNISPQQSPGMDEDEAMILNGDDSPQVSSGSQRVQTQTYMPASTTPLAPRRLEGNVQAQTPQQRVEMENEMLSVVLEDVGSMLTRSVRKCAAVATPLRNGNDANNTFGA